MAMYVSHPAAAPSQPSPRANALASLSTTEGRPVSVLIRSSSGKDRQPGMLSGDTAVPPRSIGPPHPTPHATGSMPALRPASSTASTRTATPVHGSSPSVGARSRTRTSPTASTRPTSSLVPPTSTASTDTTSATVVVGESPSRLSDRDCSRGLLHSLLRRRVLGHLREHLAGGLREARGGRARADLPPRRGPPVGRGRPRRRQDEPGEG